MTTEPRQEAISIVNHLAVDARRVENWYYERVESRERLVDVLAAAIKVRNSHGGPPPQDAVEWTVNAEALHELHEALSALREDET